MDQLLVRTVALAMAVGVCVGCGGANLESVKGTVTMDGAPLAGARVTIAPKDAAAAKDPKLRGPFVGSTDDQGRFALGPVDNPSGGAPSGAYSLGITTAHNSGADENAPPPVERVPAPYSSGGVDFEVPAGGVIDAKFDLTSK